ncbi:hypothetical protein HALLA_06115 [Halostagnicola larsenii XH-48]|uniref:Uncharacterized protein n=1 Tax=Halostagnicola larsenii XH-48 TaxID=797299 RepID=W0JNB7_9EURY|nr:hypothetical protein [Halostagnicola larsenii]AHF98482.1 hypothetical protein HALLA_06115 [Halostagnicola larsenii XH-48]
MRRSIVIGIVLLAVAFLFIGGPSLFLSSSTGDVAPESEDRPEPQIHSFEDVDSGIWPYLSPRQDHVKRSPINVIVRGESEEIVELLTEEAEGDWEELDENETAADSDTYPFFDDDEQYATGTEWGETTGATRYAWVDPGEESEPYWTTETLQVDDGDYYGERMHIRLYEAPDSDDDWVAMQTHTEHFDWFTLRHRVDGSERAQLKVESEFMELPSVDSQEDVQRINLENSGPSDADGWATVVDLLGMALTPVAIGLASQQTMRERTPDSIDKYLTESDWRRIEAAAGRIEAGHIVLSLSILAMFLGVRVTGIALERSVDMLTMHMIAALLYPVIAVGIPVVTYLIARGLTRRLDAAITGSGALILAIWLDYGLMNVDSLAVDVVGQRILVVVALGLIAGGAAKRATRESWLNDLLVVGVVMWVLLLGGTLFGYF